MDFDPVSGRAAIASEIGGELRGYAETRTSRPVALDEAAASFTQLVHDSDSSPSALALKPSPCR